MGFLFDANGSGGISGSVPVSGAEVIFRLKALLVSAGWTVTQSCDGPNSGTLAGGTGGNVYNGSADILTTSVAGAGGLKNPYAWFVIAAPSPSTRQFLFQAGSTAATDASQWRVKYSLAAGFINSPGPQPVPYNSGAKTTGVPDTVNFGTPWAADERIFIGGGDDVLPTFAQLMPADGSFRFNAIAGASPTAPCFLYWGNTPGSNWAVTTFLFDVMQSGSFVGADTDNAVSYIAVSAADSILNTDLTAGVIPQAVGSAIGALTFVAGFQSASTPVFPTGGGVNFFTGKDDFSPVPWGALSPRGWKGVSSILFWNSISRPYGNPYQVSSPKDYVTITGDSTGTNSWVAVPWNGSTLLV